MLPEQPPTFRPPTVEERPWWWRLEDNAGVEIDLGPATRFPSQGDAESWIGETWHDLRSQGVDAVSLFEVDRLVYGPMSLHT